MEQECLRCGTLLPEGEQEGICPTCGVAYGRQTLLMPSLSLEEDPPPPEPAPPPVVEAPAVEKAKSERDVETEEVPPAEMSLPPQLNEPSKRRSTGLWIVLGALFVIILLAIVALLFLVGLPRC